MNLYTVKYKPYSWQDKVESISVVARHPTAALEGAKFVMRRRSQSTGEILSVDKEREIHRVEK